VSGLRTVILVGRCEACVLLTLPVAAYFGYQGTGKPNWIIEHPAYLLVWNVGLLCTGITNLRYSRACVKLFLAQNRWQRRKAPAFLQPLLSNLAPGNTSFTVHRWSVIFGSTVLTLVGAAGIGVILAHIL
jgi:hypothetical protein